MEITRNIRAHVSCLSAYFLALTFLPLSASQAMMMASTEMGTETPHRKILHSIYGPLPNGQRLVTTDLPVKVQSFRLRTKTPRLRPEERQRRKRAAEEEAPTPSTAPTLSKKAAPAAVLPPPLKRPHTSPRTLHPLLTCAHYFGGLYAQDTLLWKQKGYGWYASDLAPFFYNLLHTAATTRIRDNETFWARMITEQAPHVTRFEHAPTADPEAQINLNQQLAQRKQRVLRALFWAQMNHALSKYSMRFPDPSQIFVDISHLAMQYTHPETMEMDLDLYSLQGGRPFKVQPRFSSGVSGAQKSLMEEERAKEEGKDREASTEKIAFDPTLTSPPARPIRSSKPRRGRPPHNKSSGRLRAPPREVSSL